MQKVIVKISLLQTFIFLAYFVLNFLTDLFQGLSGKKL